MLRRICPRHRQHGITSSFHTSQISDRVITSSRKRKILCVAGRSFSAYEQHDGIWRCNKSTIGMILAGVASVSVAAKSYYSHKRDSHELNDQSESDINASNMNNVQMLATSASTPKLVNSHTTEQQYLLFLSEDEKPSEEVDFIIIGHGNAGQSAAKVLAKRCPQAKIMVVNPYPVVPSFESENKIVSKDRYGGTVRHLTGSAMGFNHSKQTVDVFASPYSGRDHGSLDDRSSYDNDERPKMKRISYKHSVLICSGVRGAPPPKSLIDERATERILELRSTQLPSLNQYLLNLSLNTTSNEYDDGHGIGNGMLNSNYIYPVLPKQSVRQMSLMAASQGARLCILGSGFEAVELAASASISRSTSEVDNGKIKGMNKNNISLMFGRAAPLGGILPRYLSTAVSKRLRAHGIDIGERTVVRYISYMDPSKDCPAGNVEVHMAKSYDTLDTRRYKADLVVVAPSVTGQQGCAAIPAITAPSHSHKSAPNLSYNPWAKLSPLEGRVISCYSDDGRIVVNAELSAASNVYAAGSVAKYPNHNTGHATVAGEGVLDGTLAGKIAAENMAKDYYDREKRSGKSDDVIRKTNVFSKSTSLPVVRSDRLSTNSLESSTKIKSGLSALGIRALCVGQCDSEIMSTHGFFWTNQSRRLTRRRSNAGGSKHDCGNRSAVYGQGVIFYLDRAGTIRGVMLWGLPFTKSGNDGDLLNKDIVERMKKIIHTNGEVIRNDHRDAIGKMRLDPTLLCPSHLAEESMSLASLAISKPSSGILRKRRLPRPLHRYVPSKPISITSMGTLKKSAKIGTGGIGEDIFERDGHDLGFYEGERSRHPSLVHYFTYDWSSLGPIALDDMDDERGLSEEYVEFNNGERLSKNPDHAARPPKEEPLWLRKNEAAKMLSLDDKLSEAFMQNIRRGHFSDGSDPVKQAPTPKIISDAREEFNKFVGRD